MYSPIINATLQATAIASISNIIAQLLEEHAKQVGYPHAAISAS
jgi:hypothetical protein